MTQIRKYIGSCAEDSIGIGTMIIGSDYRTSNGDYAFEIYYSPSDEWIYCYDMVVVEIDNDKQIMHVAG